VLKEEDKIEYIQKYLTGSLTLEELAFFENEMRSNKALAQEIQLERELRIHYTHVANASDKENAEDLREYLRGDEAAKIKETLSKGQKLYKEETVKTRSRSRIWYRAAAAIILLFGLGAILNTFVQTSPQALYTEYYSTSDLPSLVQRGDPQNTLSLGLDLFNNGSYKGSLKQFSLYQENNHKANPNVLLYEGLAYAELNQILQAQQKLDAFISLKTIDSPKAYWFKALVALKSDNTKEALRILEQLQKTSPEYKTSEILNLLRQLN